MIAIAYITEEYLAYLRNVELIISIRQLFDYNFHAQQIKARIFALRLEEETGEEKDDPRWELVESSWNRIKKRRLLEMNGRLHRSGAQLKV